MAGKYILKRGGESGQTMNIPYELKKDCVEARKTKSQKQVYDEIFFKQHPYMSFETFRHKIRHWEKQQMADDKTLELGTYEDFIAHDATVQVDHSGNIIQAWIKQGANNNQYEQILEAIKENIKPEKVAVIKDSDKAMLELPFFDMHFGVAKFENYKSTQVETLEIVGGKKWEEINIILGQDLLHTNDTKGHTVKGTFIGKIDFGKAWKDAWRFWAPIIDKSLKSSKKVNIRYSKGNHDECSSWCFMQALKARYPQINIDESFKERKCILWNGCFIGYGHCEYTGNLSDIFQDFVLDFPTEFASAKVREIHTGHLHRESQDKGMMVRRLATGAPTDEWSDDNGFVGSHKRFQVFEWGENRLKGIYYV